MSSTIIGIDLGTSTTEAAVIRDGKPVMIVNLDQEIIILSPDNTAIDVKRKIGTNEKIMLG